MTFTKAFTLNRHQETKHHLGSERYLCPHVQCTRKGNRSSFEREDGLRRHLQNCKYQCRDDSSPSLSKEGARTPSVPKRSLPSAGESDGRRQRKRMAVRGGDGVSGAEELIEVLRREYKARTEALETKERECRRERESLDILAVCIQGLEGKRDTE